MALTSDACHKGLPKSATGEIPQFKGQPESHLSAERERGGASEGWDLREAEPSKGRGLTSYALLLLQVGPNCCGL